MEEELMDEEIKEELKDYKSLVILLDLKTIVDLIDKEVNVDSDIETTKILLEKLIYMASHPYKDNDAQAIRDCIEKLGITDHRLQESLEAKLFLLTYTMVSNGVTNIKLLGYEYPDVKYSLPLSSFKDIEIKYNEGSLKGWFAFIHTSVDQLVIEG